MPSSPTYRASSRRLGLTGSRRLSGCGPRPLRCSGGSQTARALSLCLALWCVLIGATAGATEPAAGPSAPSPSPETTFAEAVKIFKSGDAARALPLFLEIGDMTSSPNVQLYIGYCQVELGRNREAHRAFSLALKQSLDLGGTKYGTTREAARDELAKLNLRLANLTISLIERPANTVVRLDGEVVDSASLGSPLIVDPGLHQVKAEAEGRRTTVREISVDAGGSKTIALLLEEKIDQVTAPRTQPERDVAGRRDWRGSRLTMIGLVVSAVGVVGLGTFAAAGIRARSVYNRLQTECPNGCADASHRSDINDGTTFQTVANVGLALGIAGTLTGATLLYLGLADGGSAKPAVAVAPGLVKISYGGSF